MVFERKETIEATETAEKKNYFWTILQWYWVVVTNALSFIFAGVQFLS